MGSARMSYAGSPSVTQKNRVNPTAKVTPGKTKAPKEAMGAGKVTPDATPKTMSYSGAGTVTPKGYPRPTFKGSFPPNKPINYGSGKVKMGSK